FFVLFFFFFFQAEDGIRDFHVTGVQTCALPISWRSRSTRPARRPHVDQAAARRAGRVLRLRQGVDVSAIEAVHGRQVLDSRGNRSEERRVGKEGRGQRWAAWCEKRDSM